MSAPDPADAALLDEIERRFRSARLLPHFCVDATDMGQIIALARLGLASKSGAAGPSEAFGAALSALPALALAAGCFVAIKVTELKE